MLSCCVLPMLWPMMLGTVGMVAPALDASKELGLHIAAVSHSCFAPVFAE